VASEARGSSAAAGDGHAVSAKGADAAAPLRGATGVRAVPPSADGPSAPMQRRRREARHEAEDAQEVPPLDFDRLERYTQAWGSIFRSALPAAGKEAAPIIAEAAAFAATLQAAHEAQEARLHPPSESFDAGTPPPGPGSPGLDSEGRRALAEPEGLQRPEVISTSCSFGSPEPTASSRSGPSVDSPNSIFQGVASLVSDFERLFSDPRDENPPTQDPGVLKFRVQVQNGYPGVQFRRSKSLDDRYNKFARNGILVRGKVEEDGQWLRLNDKLFLPMRVNGVQVLEAADEQTNKKSFWFACGQGNMEEDEDVMSNIDDVT